MQNDKELTEIPSNYPYQCKYIYRVSHIDLQKLQFGHLKLFFLKKKDNVAENFRNSCVVYKDHDLDEPTN